MTGQNATQRWAANAGRTPSFTRSGQLRGFRSVPGAPMANPPSGLTPMESPVRRADADASWGATFGARSVYGTSWAQRFAASGQQGPVWTPPAKPALGTAGNPLVMTPAEREHLAFKRAASNASPKPFMPDATRPIFNFKSGIKPGETDPAKLAASLAENKAFAADPSSFIAGSTLPADASPDDIHKHVIASLEKWHADTGTPLPKGPLPGRELPGTASGAAAILAKYETKNPDKTAKVPAYFGPKVDEFANN